MKCFSLVVGLCLLFSVNVLAESQVVPKQGPEGKWGYYKDGQWVIGPKYERAMSFSEGLAVVKLNGMFGCINALGEQVTPFRFAAMLSFSNGMAAVKLNGKWGYIDKNGTSVIPYRFDEAKSFSEGLAPVFYYGKWGFINMEGKSVISYQYDSANPFSDGLANVRRNGVWGFIDAENNWYNEKDEYIPRFTDYAKRYVERQINKWQMKGRYEKTSDWNLRVNAQARQEKITFYTKEAEKFYIQEMGKALNMSQKISSYDADNEIFLVKDDNFGDLLVPVPIADAPKFEDDFYKMKRSVRYFIDNDKLGLAELTFTDDAGKTYTYDNQASLEYSVTNIDYKFAPIEIDQSAITRMEKGEQRISYAKLKGSAVSDVDMNIPVSKKVNQNTFAIVIANELYKHEEQVPYARTDGESFRNYCVKTLGLPEDHVHFSSDATLNEMRMAMNW